jgi:biopolymer transport protein ExbD
MAEMQTAARHPHKGVRQRKKLSTRVDLTPMVDLGFLLITFFVFTATLNEAHAMKLVMPDERPTPNPVLAPESKTISVLLGADNTVYYYPGLALASMKLTNYSASGIRQVLQDKEESDHRRRRKG